MFNHSNSLSRWPFDPETICCLNLRCGHKPRLLVNLLLQRAATRRARAAVLNAHNLYANAKQNVLPTRLIRKHSYTYLNNTLFWVEPVNGPFAVSSHRGPSSFCKTRCLVVSELLSTVCRAGAPASTTSSKESGNFALKCGNATIYLIMAWGTPLSVAAENINGIISIMDLVFCTRLATHKWGLPLSLELWCPPFKDALSRQSYK